ncbi:hypothetical protein A0J61_01202 [Choanephora cucurbitarum]|uniref:Transmembrane protein 198 n=1 Tax=Choanephora cucurbitarum TaxID=101091 RepID=A0A1C7NNQ8_9FUNG|nr:hypothetical protein A0J61_01202 [Choanephora cucurbitarum]
MYYRAYLIVFWAFFLTYFLTCARNNSKENCTTTETITSVLPTSTIILVPKPTSTYKPDLNSSECYCIQDVAVVSLLIIFGSVMILGGFKLFRVTITLAGFTIGCLQINEPFESYPNASALYLGVCIGVGLVFGIILMVFYRIGMYALVMLAGVLLTLFICGWREDFVIQNFVYRSILALALMTLFVFGLVFTEFIAIVLSTSWIGSCMIGLGIDLLIQTGFVDGLLTLLDFNAKRNSENQYHLNQFLVKRFAPNQYHPDWKVQSLMGGIIGLCLVSSVFQGWFNRGNRFGLNVIRNTNDTISKIQ